MKNAILGLIFASTTSLACAAGTDTVTVHITVSEQGKRLAQLTERVAVGEALTKCVGTNVRYPADVPVTNPHTCNGMMVKIDPLLPALKSIRIKYRVEYYRVSNRVSTVDPRLPVFDGTTFTATYDAKPGQAIDVQSATYVLSLSVDY